MSAQKPTDSQRRSSGAVERRAVRNAERERCRRAIATAHPETYLPAKRAALKQEGNPRSGTAAYERAQARAYRQTVAAHRAEFDALMAAPPPPKRGRGPSGERGPQSVLGVRISAEVHERLRNEAERRFVGMGLLVERAVESALDRWEGQALA